jgi:Domain of unknown function (DUF4407)
MNIDDNLLIRSLAALHPEPEDPQEAERRVARFQAQLALIQAEAAGETGNGLPDFGAGRASPEGNGFLGSDIVPTGRLEAVNGHSRSEPGLNGNGSPAANGAVHPAMGLDAYVTAVGGLAPEDFPGAARPPDSGQAAGLARKLLGLPGRFLLRLINVLPEQCPREERTKFYLMSATVLLNASVAAYTIPTGMTVAYPALNGAAKAGLALLGGAIVGVMDALIVGYWVSAAKYRIDPPDEPPPLPGPLRRFGVFIPRLAFTGIIVFGLGLLLTLSANTGVIAKQASLDAIHDRNAAIAAAQAVDNATIAADTAKLKTAVLQLQAAQNKQTADANRASCELYGTPRVPGCSLERGPGPNYRYFENAATGSDQQAVNSAQAEVNSLQAEITKARADKANQEKIKDVQVAARVPTGLSAVNAEWNQYADSHGLNFADRYLMELLILGVDLVPLGMKLFGGISSYEAIAWEREWNDAVISRGRRRAAHARLAALTGLYASAAAKWRETRLRKLGTWLDADADNAGRPPQPLPVAPQSNGDAPGGQAHTAAPPPPTSRRRPDDGPNPIREGRDAAVGDVVQLAAGPYKLLAQLTTRASYNGDVFIAVRIRNLGQAAGGGLDVPVRAVKFTRAGDTPARAELDFVNRFPAPGETLLRTQPRPTAGNLRLIYESQYFPRSDIMRYLYGAPRLRVPRVTVGQVVEIMRSVCDAHRRIWEEGFLHNDTRLRNLIMTGPLEDGRYNPDQLTPPVGRAGGVLLCDWGSLTKANERHEWGTGVTVSVLESDPAVLRALFGLDEPSAPGQPLQSFVTDQYGMFACGYQLLTGGISPTEGMLVYGYGNDQFAVASLEHATYEELVQPDLRGWPDALVTNPLPVRELNPDVPPALAAVIDAGVRANPLEREPAVLPVGGTLRARDVAGASEEAIDQAAAALSGTELERWLPTRHEHFLWQLDEPVGWPDEVLGYVANHWPEYGVVHP